MPPRREAEASQKPKGGFSAPGAMPIRDGVPIGFLVASYRLFQAASS